MNQEKEKENENVNKRNLTEDLIPISDDELDNFQLEESTLVNFFTVDEIGEVDMVNFDGMIQNLLN